MRVAIIPARGGSVRVPRKNIRTFHGKPIIGYSIEAAHACGLFDRVVVSTDDVEIGQVANSFGADALLRPDGWNDVGTQEVAARVLEQIGAPGNYPTHACVIYATSPMLAPEYLHAGWAELRGSNAVFAFAVGTEPLRDAGMFYWGESWAFLKRVPLISPRTVMVPMPERRVCDIDTESDWRRAESMYAALHAEVIAS